ncbi:flagellar protein FliS [Sphingobium sufflavum]|uniref:flagellar export chaperone FliS n=1 Tax=Sphingobium sufflavum TaxID=1129547 RepID=UPI001F1DDC17|nr:flagellar protein FliS [Sphingobium sufflavum]MCE7795639.1 flagellar protein FliS [Sphingobium sufflavum]
MFGTQGYAAASRRYAAIDAGGKIEGATPHQLVKILFDELLLAIESSALSAAAGDSAKARDKQVRALMLLRALDSSLDFDKGGDVALSLGVIYREVRQRLLVAVPQNDAERIMSAHAVIAEIAGAWTQIG